MKPTFENYHTTQNDLLKFAVVNYEVEFDFEGIEMVALGSFFEVDDQSPSHIAVYGKDEDLTLEDLASIVNLSREDTKLQLRTQAIEAVSESYHRERELYRHYY